MAATPVKTLRRKAQVWLRRCTKRRHATGAHKKDHPRSWGYDQSQIPTRQTRLPRRLKIHAPRRHETARKHANALGTDS